MREGPGLLQLVLSCENTLPRCDSVRLNHRLSVTSLWHGFIVQVCAIVPSFLISCRTHTHLLVCQSGRIMSEISNQKIFGPVWTVFCPQMKPVSVLGAICHSFFAYHGISRAENITTLSSHHTDWWDDFQWIRS